MIFESQCRKNRYNGNYIQEFWKGKEGNGCDSEAVKLSSEEGLDYVVSLALSKKYWWQDTGFD